ncbi:MAG: hypothetical protein JSV62_15225 [Promethearchaeota archaeon]|nr:MAG: hypothetical protein JSV62_15225 [Candidatus Lokiarchaeota archaeon]
MILQIDFTEHFLKPLGKFGGFFLLILGIMWLLYAAYETKRRKSFKKRKVEDWDFDITKVLKALTYIGFIVGLLSLVSGVSGLMYRIPPSTAYAAVSENDRNLFTSILLIVFGILTFVKPANDLPLASIVGMLVASVVVILLALLIPQTVVDLIAVFINPKLLLAIVFIIIFAIIALTAKFYTAGFMAVSKAISWPPLAVIFAIFCLLQGFLLLVVGVSISGFF